MKNRKSTAVLWRIARRAFLAALVLACLSFAPAGAAADAAPSLRLPGGGDSYQLLLIGSDQRDESWNGNSDVMILVTIHASDEKIIMTSFMRDLYADIPEYGVHKLNYAYAAGGAETLVDTLQDNYDLSIDNYMIVNFESMAEIIDAVGGVEISVTEEEIEFLNMYLQSMEVPQYCLSCGGDYLLNGYQAVAYMRIRYVGNSDYERTQRQRDVLRAIFDGIETLDVEAMTKLTAKVLPKLRHDIDLFSLMQLTADLPVLAGYDLEEQRIPYDDLYYVQDEMLVPDFEETIYRLHEVID